MFYFFSSLSMKMNKNNINFDKMILILIKYYSVKQNNMVKIAHLYTLSDITIMMFLDDYV